MSGMLFLLWHLRFSMYVSSRNPSKMNRSAPLNYGRTRHPENRLSLVRATEQGPSLCVLATANALGLARFDRGPLRLVEGNAQRFGTGRRCAFVLGLGTVDHKNTIRQGSWKIAKSKTHALPLRSLISSSHASSSHQGMTTMFLLSRAGTKASQLETSTTWDSKVAVARANISFWIISRTARTSFSRFARAMGFLTPVSRRTLRVCFFARSLGPISRRRGTPYAIKY